MQQKFFFFAKYFKVLFNICFQYAKKKDEKKKLNFLCMNSKQISLTIAFKGMEYKGFFYLTKEKLNSKGK